MRHPGPTVGSLRFIDWRKNSALNQVNAARALEIDQGLLSQLEKGFRRPSLALAIAIEDKTGISARLWLQPAADQQAA